MTEIEFNLLDEPWIRVMTRERKIDELSLPEALIESHKYVDFAGENRKSLQVQQWHEKDGKNYGS